MCLTCSKSYSFFFFVWRNELSSATYLNMKVKLGSCSTIIIQIYDKNKLCILLNMRSGFYIYLNLEYLIPTSNESYVS